MPLVIFRCFHKAVAIIYKPRVTSLLCMLKLMKTYFKDSEKQGRLEGVCQAVLVGPGWFLQVTGGLADEGLDFIHKAGGGCTFGMR